MDGHERLGYLMGFEHLTFCASGSVAWAGKSSSAPASRPRRRPGTDERVRAVGCRPQLHAGGAGDPAGRALLPRAGYEESAIYLRKILDDQASE